MAVKVILVLEQPWWGIEDNLSQASVIPFFEGLAQLTDCRPYSASFFGLDGFRQGLAHLAEAAERHRNGFTSLRMAPVASWVATSMARVSGWIPPWWRSR